MLEPRQTHADHLSKNISTYCNGEFKDYEKWLKGIAPDAQLDMLLKTFQYLTKGYCHLVEAHKLAKFIIDVGNLFIQKVNDAIFYPSSEDNLTDTIGMVKSILSHIQRLLDSKPLKNTFAKLQKSPLLIEELLQNMAVVAKQHVQSKKDQSVSQGNFLSPQELVELLYSALNCEQLTAERSGLMIAAIGSLATSGWLTNRSVNLNLPKEQPLTKTMQMPTVAGINAWILGLGQLAVKKLLKNKQSAKDLNYLFRILLQQQPGFEPLLSAMQGATLLIKSANLKHLAKFNTDILGDILLQFSIDEKSKKDEIKVRFPTKKYEKRNLRLEILSELEKFYQCLPAPHKKIPIEPISAMLQLFLEEKPLLSETLVSVLSKIGRLLKHHQYSSLEMEDLKKLMGSALETIAKDSTISTANSVEAFYAAVLADLWEPPGTLTTELLQWTIKDLEKSFKAEFIKCLRHQKKYQTILAEVKQINTNKLPVNLADTLYEKWIAGEELTLTLHNWTLAIFG